MAARAGHISTWKFHYTPAITLPEGTRLKFDLLTEGRDIDWEPPTVDLNEGANVIYVLMEDGEIVEGEELETPEGTVQYEFTLPQSVEAEKKVSIVVGTLPDAKQE